jgi:hypothetical protein
MRNPGWTPSIVPSDEDHTAYIVVDDFGPIGRSYRETDAERADLEAVIIGCWRGSITTRSVWLASTRPMAGREMSRQTLLTRCGIVATSKCATCLFIWKNLSSGAKVAITTFSFRSRYACSDRWHSSTFRTCPCQKFNLAGN